MDDLLALKAAPSGQGSHRDLPAQFAPDALMPFRNMSVIDWSVAGGEAEDGREYPMWYGPPIAGQPRPDIFRATALRLAGALGYLWLGYVESRLPALTRGRCDEQSLSNNQPVVRLATGGNQACTDDREYSCLLNIRDDSRADAKRHAGRDPEFLAVSADTRVASRQAEAQTSVAGGVETGTSSVAGGGSAKLDAELGRLRLEWPLQTIRVDEERDSEAVPPDGEEITVVFDDITAYAFEGAIDTLVTHLQSQAYIGTAERQDREYIVPELRPGVTGRREGDDRCGHNRVPAVGLDVSVRRDRGLTPRRC